MYIGKYFQSRTWCFPCVHDVIIKPIIVVFGFVVNVLFFRFFFTVLFIRLTAVSGTDEFWQRTSALVGV